MRITKAKTKSILLTFVLLGYYPRSQVLSDSPSQDVLGYKQRTNEQRKAMLSKRYDWVLLPRTRNVGVYSDPGAGEYSYKATPNNVPHSPTMREVGTTICLQREFVERWDETGVDRLGGSLDQVVDKDEK